MRNWRISMQDWRRQVTLRNGFLLAALLVLLPLALYNMQGWVRLLVYPGEANFGEGMLVAEAQRLARGENIYGDHNSPPYWVVTYPPLFQVLSAPLAWTGLWWSRLLTIISSCVMLWIFVLLGRRLTGTSLTGLVAGALYVNSPAANAWSAIARTDTMGRMFESASIACALLISNPRRALWGAIACSTLAMLTKQNMIAGGIVAFWILWTRQPRLALYFSLGWVGITTGTYLLIDLVTGGFFEHILGLTSRRISGETILFWLGFFWHTHQLYLLAVVPGVLFAAARRETWWLLVAVLAAVPMVIMAGNGGADRNYFLDLLWPLCLLIPYGIARLAEVGHTRLTRTLAQAVLVTVIGVVAWNTYRAWTIFRMPYPGSKERSQTRRVTRNLEKMGGPVLSEVVGNTIMAGYKPEVAPFIMNSVASAGEWDPTPIIEKVKRKEYKTILLTQAADGRYPAPLLEAVFQNYDHVKHIPDNYLIEDWVDYNVFRPKSETPPATGGAADEFDADNRTTGGDSRE